MFLRKIKGHYYVYESYRVGKKVKVKYYGSFDKLYREINRLKRKYGK